MIRYKTLMSKLHGLRSYFGQSKYQKGLIQQRITKTNDQKRVKESEREIFAI